MKLTRERAIELFRELWRWLAETGKRKEDWPRWEFNGGDVPFTPYTCPLCEYTIQKSRSGEVECSLCPIAWPEEKCFSPPRPVPFDPPITYFDHWYHAPTPEMRKQYAKLIAELPER